MDPNSNVVSVWVEEEAARNNIFHLKEEVSVLALTCHYNDVSLGSTVTLTNRMWIDACEWVYFRLDTPAVRPSDAPPR